MHAQNADGSLKYPGGDENIRRMVKAGLADKIIWASDGNHVQGTLVKVIERSFQAMITAGMTEAERCAALSGTSTKIFGMEHDDNVPPGDTSSRGYACFRPTLIVFSLCVTAAMISMVSLV